MTKLELQQMLSCDLKRRYLRYSRLSTLFEPPEPVEHRPSEQIAPRFSEQKSHVAPTMHTEQDVRS